MATYRFGLVEVLLLCYDRSEGTVAHHAEIWLAEKVGIILIVPLIRTFNLISLLGAAIKKRY